MEKIKIMVSSKVVGLEAERDAIAHVFKDNRMIELIGANPFADESRASSSAVETIKMARECDLYILIIGSQYGMELPNGKSATEVEFDAAFRQDPTKILVFLKKEDKYEEKQEQFKDRVCDYYSGYWRTEFKYSHILGDLVEESVMSWIRDRATLGTKVSYCEHFIRQALLLKPTPDTQVYYRVTIEDIEIEYHVLGSSYIVQYGRKQVLTDFWKCVNELQMGIDRWVTDGSDN